jgi:hypothetical protein
MTALESHSGATNYESVSSNSDAAKRNLGLALENSSEASAKADAT